MINSVDVKHLIKKTSLVKAIQRRANRNPVKCFFGTIFFKIKTMLDINLLLEDRGGIPEAIKESQRRHSAPVEIIDEVIAEYKAWTTSMCCIFQ